MSDDRTPARVHPKPYYDEAGRVGCFPRGNSNKQPVKRPQNDMLRPKGIFRRYRTGQALSTGPPPIEKRPPTGEPPKGHNKKLGHGKTYRTNLATASVARAPNSAKVRRFIETIAGQAQRGLKGSDQGFLQLPRPMQSEHNLPEIARLLSDKGGAGVNKTPNLLSFAAPVPQGRRPPNAGEPAH
jgi:hypothetical protein